MRYFKRLQYKAGKYYWLDVEAVPYDSDYDGYSEKVKVFESPKRFYSALELVFSHIDN